MKTVPKSTAWYRALSPEKRREHFAKKRERNKEKHAQGFCPRCWKNPRGDAYTCPECRAKVREYRRKCEGYKGGKDD